MKEILDKRAKVYYNKSVGKSAVRDMRSAPITKNMGF